MQKIVTICIYIFCFTAIGYADAIYVSTDAQGVMRFSTKKPEGGSYKLFSKDTHSGYIYRSPKKTKTSGKLFLNKHKKEIRQAASRHAISEDLIRAVIHAESAFNLQARSHKGALGLMQLMPVNLKKFEVKNPFSAEENIDAGTELLSDLYAYYKGDIELTLAAYNAGQGAVRKYGGIPPYKETKHYVRKVKALYEEYARSPKSFVIRGS